jgi:hypothetical protein
MVAADPESVRRERIIALSAQYKVLSEVEEMWGTKPSKHRAYLFIHKRMKEITKELQTLNYI